VIVFLSSFAFVALFLIFTMSDSSQTSPDFEPVIEEAATEMASPAVEAPAASE